MATDFPVKYCHSGMRGAPEITKEQGTLLAALRAFLISGFGSVTAQSVAVDNGVATAVVGTGNTFEVGSVIKISGGDNAALNGEARVLTATASTITWATTAADGAVGGLVDIRYAPVGGWEEPFTGTQTTAVFRSTDPQSARHYLRVDDSEEGISHVRGYETMTDINNGTGEFPKVQAVPMAFWYKPDGNNLARWDFIADSQMMLIAISLYSAPQGYIAAPIRAFGEGVPLSAAGDNWGSLLSCACKELYRGQFGLGSLCSGYSRSYDNYGAIYLCREATGLGGAVASRCLPLVGDENSISGYDHYLGGFPSVIDGQLRYSRKLLSVAHDTRTARAVVPGVLHIPHSGVSAHISARDQIQGGGELSQGNRAMSLCYRKAHETGSCH